MPNSIRFNRSGTTAALSRTTNLPPSAGFTAMGWFRVPTLSGWMSFFQLSGAASFYQMGIEGSTGSNHFCVNTPGGDFTGTIPTNGIWFHAAVTSNGTSGSNTFGYYNGVLDLTATSVSFTANKVQIGNSTGGDPLNGNAAAIKIWDRVLSIEEINAEIPFALPVNRGGLNTSTPVPQGWERLDSGLLAPDRSNPLTRFDDWSGNGYNWTEAGTIDTEPGPPIRWAPIRAPSIYGAAAAGGGGGGTGKPDHYYRMMRAA